MDVAVIHSRRICYSVIMNAWLPFLCPTITSWGSRYDFSPATKSKSTGGLEREREREREWVSEREHMREREKQREREGDRERGWDILTDIQAEIYTEREREREREIQRHRETVRQRLRHMYTEREREREREKDAHTHLSCPVVKLPVNGHARP